MQKDIGAEKPIIRELTASSEGWGCNAPVVSGSKPTISYFYFYFSLSAFCAFVFWSSSLSFTSFVSFIGSFPMRSTIDTLLN